MHFEDLYQQHRQLNEQYGQRRHEAELSVQQHQEDGAEDAQHREHAGEGRDGRGIAEQEDDALAARCHNRQYISADEHHQQQHKAGVGRVPLG